MECLVVKMQCKNRNGLFAKLGIDFKGIHRVLCRFVELESVSNTSKKLLKKFGILGILGIDQNEIRALRVFNQLNQ